MARVVVKSRSIKFKDNWITTWQDDVVYPNGHKTLYGYIELERGVHAVVTDKNNKIILFKQYRYPVNKTLWSIPGGGIHKNETPRGAIEREIKEEIGVNITSLEKIGKNWYLCAPFVKAYYHLFIAKTSDLPKAKGESDEDIRAAKSFSKEEILNMIDGGVIEEDYVANALQIAIRKLGL